MFRNARDRFLNYYNNELRYLRNSGKIFAKQHPKIARRLELSEKESPDPHTERLLESFAFMTARLSQEIDDRFPETAAALLEVLYPHLVNPIPSMSIAQFQVDPTKGKLTKGYNIPKETPLFAYSEKDVSCRFQTIYPLTLWPIKLKKVAIVPKDAFTLVGKSKDDNWFLRLTIETQGASLGALNLDELQFHIRGERILSLDIYESLFSQVHPSVYVSVDGQTAHTLPDDSLTPIGFNRDEMTLPIPEYSTHAYQLLQEYFHLPEKFLFFKIKHLNKLPDNLNLDTNVFELLISLKGVQEILQKKLSPNNFLLGCTPIVNLFKKITEPQRLTKRKIRYRLVPDQRRDKTTEIYRILKVAAAVEGNQEPQTFSPYFSFNHQHISLKDTVYWTAKRTSAEERDLPGTDVYLSFVDLQFNPALPPHQIVYAHTLCTNRFLAEQLPQGAELQIEEAVPISKIVCLDKPVPQEYSPADGETLWRLISQLSVNHLPLTGNKEALNILKESLKLYSGSTHTYKQHEIDNIKSLKTNKIVRRFGLEAWRGFVEGIQIVMEMETLSETGNSNFLLASVLRHYFALSVSLNSFVELVMIKTDRPNEYIKWQPLPGEKILL